MNKQLLTTALIAMLTSSIGIAQASEEKTRPEGIPEDLVEIKPGMEVELPPIEKLITYTQNYYQGSQLKDNYFGKWGALEGTVIKIEKGPEDRPILQFQLSDGVEKKLWVASIVKISEDMVKVGSKLKMLGMFDKSAEEPQYMAKLSQDTDYLLAFCFYDVNTGRPMYVPRMMKSCQDWENGKRLRKLFP